MGEAFVQDRLDIACATIERKALFPCSKVTHLQASYSDHDPIMLTSHNQNGYTRGTQEKISPRDLKRSGQRIRNMRELFMKLGMGISTGGPICRLFEKIKKSSMSLV